MCSVHCTCVHWSVLAHWGQARHWHDPPPVMNTSRQSLLSAIPNLPSPHQHSAPAWSDHTMAHVMQQLFITEYPTYCLLAAPHSGHRSDLNNPAQPWPKCCLLTVIVERKWIDGIWSRAQGFLAREGGCWKLFTVHFLPIKNVCAQAPGAGQAVISSIWGPGPCPVDTGNKPLGAQLH